MKILVYPHDMNMGGSQLNAIELAAQVKKLGHEVIVFGHDGVLRERVAELGLEFVEAPRARIRPTPSIVGALRRLVEERGIDIVHGYEWPPALETTLALGYKHRTKAVSTVLSMSVAPFIPRHVSLMVGTEQIAAVERDSKRSLVGLMEPPVDTILNTPDIDVGTDSFAATWNLDPEVPVISIVSRLAHEMKLEGILAAIAVVERCNEARPLQLLIVGDGPAGDEVREAVHRANKRMGKDRIVLTGQLEDPRPAYQLADVVLGMGGSALRAMAFRKPLIVQGEKGYWETLRVETLPEFLWQGWYGVGTGAAGGEQQLFDRLSKLLEDDELRTECATFSLATVRERFSLELGAERQVRFYRAALERQIRLRSYLESMIRATMGFARYYLQRSAARFGGKVSRDDFNATPVTAGLAGDRTEVRA